MALDCALNQTTGNGGGNGVYCNVTSDSAACWPLTPSGHVAKQPCPSIFGAPMGKYVYKQCDAYGQWAESERWKGFGNSDYSECIGHIVGIESVFDINLDTPKPEVEDGGKRIDQKVLIVLTISLLCLLVSLVYLQCFVSRKSSASSYNRIWKHFIGALICEIVATIVYSSFYTIFDKVSETKLRASFVCLTLVIAKEYMETCVYVWCMVQIHFIRLSSQTRRLRTSGFTTYIFIGWGLSSVPTTIWAVTSFLVNKTITCWYDYINMPSIWIVTCSRIILIIVSLWLIVSAFTNLSKNSETSSKSRDVRTMHFNLIGCICFIAFVVSLIALHAVGYIFKATSTDVAWFDTICSIFSGTKGFTVSVIIVAFNMDFRDYFKTVCQCSSHQDNVCDITNEHTF